MGMSGPNGREAVHAHGILIRRTLHGLGEHCMVPIVHTGGCFCGKYRYEVQHPELSVRPPLNCNCSLCTVVGYMNVCVSPSFPTPLSHSLSRDVEG